MLTDGGEIHEEIESEPCAAQESNNQIPQISNHIGAVMVSFIREGIFFFFHCTAQMWLQLFYQLSNCFVDATAMFILQSFWNPFSLS